MPLPQAPRVDEQRGVPPLLPLLTGHLAPADAVRGGRRRRRPLAPGQNPHRAVVELRPAGAVAVRPGGERPDDRDVVPLDLVAVRQGRAVVRRLDVHDRAAQGVDESRPPLVRRRRRAHPPEVQGLGHVDPAWEAVDPSPPGVVLEPLEVQDEAPGGGVAAYPRLLPRDPLVLGGVGVAGLVLLGVRGREVASVAPRHETLGQRQRQRRVVLGRARAVRRRGAVAVALA
mmetsp:Transcript_11918/g.27188  ORF Transcript_11918/g.27188 Transcript_11918/m.27188 type:complete len:229 (-) Transcript_11918:170-856(-)